MKKEIAELKQFVGEEIVVRVDRQPLDHYPIHGFVVGISAKLLLIQVIDGSTLQLNGYSALRICDIRSWSIDKTFVYQALRLLGRHPVVPTDIELLNWSELLTYAQRKYGLVLIESENKKYGCGYIGSVVKQTTHCITLKQVNTEGQWDKTRKFAFKDITQVTFDDGYTQALSFLLRC